MVIMKRIFKPIKASTEANTFNIPVKWEMRAILPVPARSLKEAVKIINNKDYKRPEGEYVDDTYEIDYDRLEE